LNLFARFQLARAYAAARLQAAAHQQLAGHAHIAVHDQRAGIDEVVGLQVLELQHAVGGAEVLQQPACIFHAAGGHLGVHGPGSRRRPGCCAQTSDNPWHRDFCRARNFE
jgi:hypothetical protein